MSKLRPQRTAPREGPSLVFMGMRGVFSRIPLARLIAEGITVQAVVVPATPTHELAAAPVKRLMPEPNPSEVPLLTPFVSPNITHLAWQHGIPVLEVTRLADPETLSTLASYQSDVVCVACFNQRFPPALLTLPRYGCLNLHPSMLPAYRGPVPLFWAFRNSERGTGVTVHLMDEGIDTGDVLLQERIEIPEGIFGHVLEEQCASLGAELMVQAVQLLWAGTARPTKQPDENSSYYPWPSAEDFRISPTLSARWAFNFIRGVAYMNGPLEIHVAGERFPVRDAVSYTPAGTQASPFVQDGFDLWVQCTPGILHVKLQSTPLAGRADGSPVPSPPARSA
ncbi:MAG: methionyl-tRNA formyltransferase [Anaerolineae bacterium]